MALTQDMVLSFLTERGGTVRNAELLSAFAAHINCSKPEDRRHNRDLFKSFINDVAVVKRVEDVKYVVVKKKYRQMIKEGKSTTAPPSPLSSSSLCTTQQSCLSKCGSSSITSADVLNNNSWFGTTPSGSSEDVLTKQQLQIKSVECDAPVMTSNQEEPLTSRVLNVTNNTRQRTIGAVFAVVAIKSPQSEKIKVDHRMLSCDPKFETPPPQELNIVDARTSSNHKPDLNKSPGIKRRPTMVPSSPAPKRGNKVSKSGFNAKDSSAIPLEPLEHEWLVKSATGCWSQLYSLLLQDVHLAQKKNFISGFTALHWAAKHGNGKMVRIILDIGTDVDVNIKSHDGYTPLHVAAIHSHESVLNLLVREYGANCNIRDNSGKKAYQYLSKGLSTEVRELLGDPTFSCQVTCSREQHLCDLSKNLNTISKLFHASVRHRRKSRHRLSLPLISDGQEKIVH